MLLADEIREARKELDGYFAKARARPWKDWRPFIQFLNEEIADDRAVIRKINEARARLPGGLPPRSEHNREALA